jgi:hypothetical protein
MMQICKTVYLSADIRPALLARDQPLSSDRITHSSKSYTQQCAARTLDDRLRPIRLEFRILSNVRHYTAERRL